MLNSKEIKKLHIVKMCIGGKFYQILSPVISRKVDIEKHLDGKLYIKYNGKGLSYSEIDSKPKAEKKKRKPRKSIYRKSRPNHPWRGRYAYC